MNQHWLDIQSFLSDDKVLAAIDNLAIATKFQLTGVRDAEREQLAGAARTDLESFLKRLNTVSLVAPAEVAKGVDPRFKALADAYLLARQDAVNYQSTLMKAGIEATIALLRSDDPRSKRELVNCLAELRRIVERHQQTDVSAIIEEF